MHINQLQTASKEVPARLFRDAETYPNHSLLSQAEMIVTGVAQARVRGSGRKGHKKYWTLYFINDDGRFGTKKVSFFEAMYYKTRLHKIKYEKI